MEVPVDTVPEISFPTSPVTDDSGTISNPKRLRMGKLASNVRHNATINRKTQRNTRYRSSSKKKNSK